MTQGQPQKEKKGGEKEKNMRLSSFTLADFLTNADRAALFQELKRKRDRIKSSQDILNY